MPSQTDIEEREAKYGQKMIEVKICFWTDGIAEGKGNVKPKHALTAGIVRMRSNDPHGIKPKPPIPFRSLMQIGAAVEKCLINNGVTLHIRGKKMDRYIKE